MSPARPSLTPSAPELPPALVELSEPDDVAVEEEEVDVPVEVAFPTPYGDPDPVVVKVALEDPEVVWPALEEVTEVTSEPEPEIVVVADPSEVVVVVVDAAPIKRPVPHGIAEPSGCVALGGAVTEPSVAAMVNRPVHVGSLPPFVNW